jgi:hypothetical protein
MLVSESFGATVSDEDCGGAADPDPDGAGVLVLDEPSMLPTDPQPASAAASKITAAPRPIVKTPRMLTPAFITDGDL